MIRRVEAMPVPDAQLRNALAVLPARSAAALLENS
jgi:hypothetical protein